MCNWFNRKKNFEIEYMNSVNYMHSMMHPRMSERWTPELIREFLDTPKSEIGMLFVLMNDLEHTRDEIQELKTLLTKKETQND